VVARYLGFPRERVEFFGDHDNDLGILRWAGVGAARGQATQGIVGRDSNGPGCLRRRRCRDRRDLLTALRAVDRR